MRRILTDRQWEAIAPLCCGKEGDPGQTGGDARLFLEAVLLIDRRGRVFSGDEMLFTASLGRLCGYYSVNEPRHVIMPMLKRSIRAWDTVEMMAWATATACMLMTPVSMPVMTAGMAASIMVALISAGMKARKRMEAVQWAAF